MRERAHHALRTDGQLCCPGVGGCPVQFALGFGVHMEGQSFCPAELNVNGHKRNEGATVFLILKTTQGSDFVKGILRDGTWWSREGQQE